MSAYDLSMLVKFSCKQGGGEEISGIYLRRDIKGLTGQRKWF